MPSNDVDKKLLKIIKGIDVYDDTEVDDDEAIKAAKLIAAWSDQRIKSVLEWLNKSSKLMQSPHEYGTLRDVAYQNGAQDAHKVWHEQVYRLLAALSDQGEKTDE